MYMYIYSVCGSNYGHSWNWVNMWVGKRIKCYLEQQETGSCGD